MIQVKSILPKKHLTESQFEAFVEKHRAVTVDLFDYGQDMQRVVLSIDGEIISTDFSWGTYGGRYVDIAELKVGEPLHIYNSAENKNQPYRRLVIESIDMHVDVKALPKEFEGTKVTKAMFQRHMSIAKKAVPLYAARKRMVIELLRAFKNLPNAKSKRLR